MLGSSLKPSFRALFLPPLSICFFQSAALGADIGSDHQSAGTPPQEIVETFNSRVIKAIGEMPSGGGCPLGKDASRALYQAVSADPDGRLNIAAAKATPSFCSGAVYLVLLRALKPEIDAIPEEKTRLDLIRAIGVHGQADGIQMWGRWNSNGACMAVTMAETGLGWSSWDLKKAIPGDFLKLWWTDPIGRDGFGHSVVFLGYTNTESGEEGIEIWSSNKPGAMARTSLL